MQLGVHLEVATKVVHSDEGLQLLGEQRLQLLRCVLFAPLHVKTVSGGGMRVSSLCVVWRQEDMLRVSNCSCSENASIAGTSAWIGSTGSPSLALLPNWSCL